MKASKVAIIIDPYSSGALYALEFARHGVFCIAIQSNLPVPAHFLLDFDPLNFIGILPPSPSHELASRLSARNIVAVVAGCDTAITLADELAKELGLSFRNDPATSAARRYKDQMHKALESRSIRHIETTVFKSLREFSLRSHAFDFAATFVVKPINSAGSEGVRLAEGSRGVTKALEAAAWEQKNVLGEINSGFAVQRFIPGHEYVVDMVATREDIFIAAVGRVHKLERNGSRFVCESVDLLDPQDAELRYLTDYAQQAARSLGAISGPVHMELISGSDGPVMIEANCRLPGAGLPLLYAAVYNPDLLSASVCAYLGKSITSAITNERATIASRERHGRAVCLISEAEHEFAGLDEDDEKRLRKLKSYHGRKLYITKGDKLGKTIDFATCPGVIFLAHKSLRRLDDDEERVRSIFSRYLMTRF